MNPIDRARAEWQRVHLLSLWRCNRKRFWTPLRIGHAGWCIGYSAVCRAVREARE